ncbi:hypothetical protein D3C80_1826600 [compost metagenome]
MVALSIITKFKCACAVISAPMLVVVRLTLLFNPLRSSSYTVIESRFGRHERQVGEEFTETKTNGICQPPMRFVARVGDISC